MNCKAGKARKVTMARGALLASLAACALTLTMAASASAVVKRSLITSFGPDGTTATRFRDTQKLGFHQATHRVYVMPMFPGGGPGTEEAVGIYGFDINTPHTYTPREAPFPITGISGAAYVGGFTVDNSNTGTAGRLYEPVGGFASPTFLDAWESDGTKVGLPFPLTPGPNAYPVGPGGRFCEAAVNSTGDVFVSDIDAPRVHRFSNLGVREDTVETAKFQPSAPCAIAFDSEDNLYVSTQNHNIWKYSASSNYTEAEPWIQGGGGQLAVDKSTDHLFVLRSQIDEYDENGNLLLSFGDTFGSSAPNFTGIAVDESTHDVYAADERGRQIRVFGPPKNLPVPTTDRPTDVTTTSATLHGHVDLDGGPPVTDCFFQYGEGNAYELGTVPCQPAASPGEPITSGTDVTGHLTELSEGTRYSYRLVVTSSEGTNPGNEQTLFAVDPSFVKNQKIIEVTADHALLSAEINPKGVTSNWYIEYGPEDCAVSTCQKSPSEGMVSCGLFGCAPNPTTFTAVSQEIIGLTPGTHYHFRFVSANDQNGLGYGPDRTFKTFPLDPGGVDPCPNSTVRKLSGASKLSHCRGFELVSAADAGGYDVASNIVEGEKPLDAYPRADDRFLYTTSVGKLPGVAGYPVNLGTDPYVATRGPSGWTTKYVGLPATLPSDSPFASTMSGADATLGSYAFGEPNRCSPCFNDGTTGIPLRLANGSLVQGMAGSEDVADPEPAGEVTKPLSADGSHFVFGSAQRFEPAGNSGSVSIYDRDLKAGGTQVVSTLPDGSTMSGEVVQLDISADGSRILIGRKVGEDPLGNPLYDLYMHVGDNSDSVQIADTADGVLYDGMSSDGTKAYFTTSESLDDDADESADIFRADVGTSSAPVTRVSTGTGGTGNSDECEPPDTWNVADSLPDCSALAFAGGGGVAAGSGTLYFVSPELLDGEGHGLKDEPNLYVARPGQAPHFVALLDDSHIKPPPSPPRRPILNKTWGGSHSGPEIIAVDEANESVYVMESNAGRVSRFDLEGNQYPFSAGAGAGTNKLPGQAPLGSYENGLAVDGHEGSLMEGTFYTVTSPGTVSVYAKSGAQAGELSGFSWACGLAVDQATGDLYVGDYYMPGIRKFHPISNAGPIDNSDYEETSVTTQGMNPCQVAAGGGYAYASQWNEGPLRRFPMSEFESTPPSVPGTQVSARSREMSVDSTTGEIYVSKGKEIAVYTADEDEETPIASVGVGTVTESSRAVAVNGKTREVYANWGTGGSFSIGANIAWFGFEEVPYLLIDHPGVLHAKQQADVRSSEDIQVTPNGDDAVFTSRIPNTSQPTDGNAQVFRYDVPKDKLDCASCTPTSAITTGDAFLTPNGTNISDDGRVFFTSPEQLTLRDTNRRTDAYEWEETSGGEGVLNLVSTGTGVINAALASVSSDGKNAFFFTRESIIPQDDNGPAMKVYTAREGGGFSYLPETLKCAAADECRGPGTKVAPPPAIGTYRGTGGNLPAKTKKKKRHRCRKGQVRRRTRGGRKRGRCVKRRRARRHHHRRSHRHG